MMRFGRNSGARKVRYRKRKAQKCHLRFCGTVNKRRVLLPKRGALQVVKTKTCLWYFCGQTRNRRGFYHGDFHFWWTRRGSNPRPLRCERSALPAELRARLCLVCTKFDCLGCAICWSTRACVMLRLLSQLSYEPVELLCSSESYYTIISTVVKTIFFGTRKIFCCQFGHPIVK